jgi:hypothetical protein
MKNPIKEARRAHRRSSAPLPAEPGSGGDAVTHDLNHYRAPSRVWEWVESNWLIQTVVIVGLVYVVAAQWR